MTESTAKWSAARLIEQRRPGSTSSMSSLASSPHLPTETTEAPVAFRRRRNIRSGPGISANGNHHINAHVRRAGLRLHRRENCLDGHQPPMGLPPTNTSTDCGSENSSKVLSSISLTLKDAGNLGACACRSARQFCDLAFTHQLSTFDRNNEITTSSPFRGFYTLFWMSIALLAIRISAENWRLHGTPLGTSEIMSAMFRREGRLLQLM